MAWAADLEPLPRDWELAYHRAQDVTIAGEVAAVAGPLIAAVGVGATLIVTVRHLDFSDPHDAAAVRTEPDFRVANGLMAVGGVIALAAPPLIAGGGTRMRRTLLERGVDAPAGLAWISWGLTAGTAAFAATAYALEDRHVAPTLAMICYAGAVTTGIFSHKRVKRAHDEAFAPFARPRPRLAVIPSGHGVGLAGAF